MSEPPVDREGVRQQVPTQQIVSFMKLSQDSNEVLIEHEGQVYRLRLTKNGKLILNK